jgi:hypothetical protein
VRAELHDEERQPAAGADTRGACRFTRPPPDNLDEIMRDVAELTEEMKSAGAWVFAGGLHPPSSASVVRANLVTDGPFIETKEQLGGFTVIDAPDLDAALEWARRTSRATTLPIEVRPFSG